MSELEFEDQIVDIDESVVVMNDMWLGEFGSLYHKYIHNSLPVRKGIMPVESKFASDYNGFFEDLIIFRIIEVGGI